MDYELELYELEEKGESRPWFKPYTEEDVKRDAGTLEDLPNKDTIFSKDVISLDEAEKLGYRYNNHNNIELDF